MLHPTGCDIRDADATDYGPSIDDDLRRMDRINREFASKSDGMTWRRVVRFDHDMLEADRPWMAYVADESTYYATLDDAVAGAVDSLREAAEVLGELTK